jgi:hypothetical protein
MVEGTTTKANQLITLGLFLCVVLSITWILSAHLHIENVDKGESNHLESSLRKSSFSSEAYRLANAFDVVHVNEGDRRIALILQQSPVDTMNQKARLEVIDDSWAIWCEEVDVKLYAVLPYPITTDFHHINSLTVEANLVPFQKFVNALTSLMFSSTSSNSFEWIVMANEHSWFIPHNLRRYLQYLDAEDLVYTGNRLKISYKGKNLDFASGGSGLVLSHTSVRALLVSWALTGVFDLPCSLSRKEIQFTPFRIAASSDDLETVICSLLRWKKGLTRITKSYFLFLLSRTRGILFEKSSYDKEITFRIIKTKANIKMNTSFNTVSVIKPNSVEELQKEYNMSNKSSVSRLRECAASGKWEKDNPGILVAHCLLNIFTANFPSTESDHGDVDGERFHVYGMVRTVKDDVDEWYRAAKRRNVNRTQRDGEHQENNKVLSSSELESVSHSHTHDLASIMHNHIPVDTISFHYVSSVEARLLFNLLHGSESLDMLDEDDLLKRWPQSNADIGPYSARLRTKADAKKILRALQDIHDGLTSF